MRSRTSASISAMSKRTILAATILVSLVAVPSLSLSAPAIRTIAGTGKAEDNGDHGPALKVNVGNPFGVEVGPDGALYICEISNHRVLRLDLKSNELTTVAGNG